MNHSIDFGNGEEGRRKKEEGRRKRAKINAEYRQNSPPFLLP
jgi:hypothetical protein